MTGSEPPNPSPSEPPPGRPDQSLDLVRATVWYRAFVLLSAFMWSLGIARSVLRDIEDANPAMPVVLDFGLLCPLLAVLVGIGVAAMKVASGLGFPRAWAWLGAWVPCVNPFAVLILGAAVSSRLGQRGLGFSALFRRRADLEESLSE